MSPPSSVVVLCRAGFEAEAASDLRAVAERSNASLECAVDRGTGFVVGRSTGIDAERWRRAWIALPPIFVRTAMIGTGPYDLDRSDPRGRPDRVSPLIDAIIALAPPPLRSVWVEFADSDEGKRLSALARALEPRLREALRLSPLEDDTRATRLHVFLVDGRTAYVGTSDAATGSSWPMGIPRLRMPHSAPSRSTLKLAEAIAVFVGARETALLRPGLCAVDLGAAPGGWTWQLVRRGLRVIAVDNGALKGDVANDPLVTHVRDDGVRWRPRRPVDWLVCDIVEQPRRIAALVADWIADGAARRAIFNLKLPMKKRYEEIALCRGLIERRLLQAQAGHRLALRQLYHDREEVTGFLERID